MNHLSNFCLLTSVLFCAGCSDASTATKEQLSEETNEAKIQLSSATTSPAVEANISKGSKDQNSEASIIYGKKDVTVDGEQSCKVEFAYAGMSKDSVTWKGEPCKAVSALFLNREMLEKYKKWDRLVMNVKENVVSLPDGKVFYVEGTFTASIYPLNYEGELYEYAVAD